MGSTMSEQNIHRTLQISQEEWLPFVNQFTIVNQGRRFTLEVDNFDLGNEVLLQHASLSSITYDEVTNHPAWLMGRSKVIGVDPASNPSNPHVTRKAMGDPQWLAIVTIPR
jgi:hypothetical protein